MFVLELNMNDEQKATYNVIADCRIACFIVSARVDDSKQRIKEYFGRMLERNAIVRQDIDPSFLVVPYEGRAIQFKADVH
jgi:hypothetical protein